MANDATERARRFEAPERARELFEAQLTSQQREDYQQFGYIDIVGSEGHRYRIFTNMGVSGNVLWESETSGMWRGGLCAYYPEVPTYDTFLGQKLMLETDEQKFLKKAYGLHPPWSPKKDGYTFEYQDYEDEYLGRAGIRPPREKVRAYKDEPIAVVVMYATTLVAILGSNMYFVLESLPKIDVINLLSGPGWFAGLFWLWFLRRVTPYRRGR